MTLLAFTLLAIAVALLGVTLWNALAWPRVGAARADAARGLESTVSILIPARDEEANVAACLDAALAQGAVVREVLVYDDHSRDATARIVGDYARLDARVRLVEPVELPAGWCGFQKNFFPAFRRERGFWAFVALHALVFLLPFALAPLAYSTPWARPFAATAACVLLMRAALAARFGHAWWSVALHPLGEAVLLALGLTSWLRCRTGRGVVWKGRRYRAGARV